jgi:hypothetical protein
MLKSLANGPETQADPIWEASGASWLGKWREPALPQLCDRR